MATSDSAAMRNVHNVHNVHWQTFVCTVKKDGIMQDLYSQTDSKFCKGLKAKELKFHFGGTLPITPFLIFESH